MCADWSRRLDSKRDVVEMSVLFALGSIPKTSGEVPRFLRLQRAAICFASPETEKWVNSSPVALDSGRADLV